MFAGRNAVWISADRRTRLDYDPSAGRLNTYVDGILQATLPYGVAQGNTYYVSSVLGNDANNGRTPFQPVATLGHAVALCTANQGDMIYVLPGHVETVNVAAFITFSVAGITIQCIGDGGVRPTFTWASSTAATMVVSANNVTIRNMVGVCNIDQVVTAFTVSGSGCTIDVEWQDSATNKEAISCITTTAAADKLNISLRYMGQTGGSHCATPIKLVGCDEAIINVSFYGKASTAVVNFATTASSGIRVYGDMYNSGTTDGSKNVVDTITGSTWLMDIFDGAAGARQTGGSAQAVGSLTAVPAADATTNAYTRDVVGNKSDAAVTAVGTTKSILAYAKGLITMGTVQVADSTNNAFEGDVTGNKSDATQQTVGTTRSLMGYVKGIINALIGSGAATFPSSAAPANSVSLAAVLREIFDQSEKVISTITPATMPQATTVTFTVAGGAIEIWQIISRCITTNNGNAATLQWTWAGTLGTATTFTAASGSLASLVAGDLVITDLTALSTAPLIMSTGIGAVLGSPTTQRYVITNGPGNVSAVVGTAAATGTWGHHMRYRPLGRGVTVTAAF